MVHGLPPAALSRSIETCFPRRTALRPTTNQRGREVPTIAGPCVIATALVGEARRAIRAGVGTWRLRRDRADHRPRLTDDALVFAARATAGDDGGRRRWGRISTANVREQYEVFLRCYRRTHGHEFDEVPYSRMHAGRGDGGAGATMRFGPPAGGLRDPRTGRMHA